MANNRPIYKRVKDDFMDGLTVLGLARKYGYRVFQIENMIRRNARWRYAD